MKAELNAFPFLTFAHGAAPAAPTAGSARVYADSAGRMYLVDPDGAAHELAYVGDAGAVPAGGAVGDVLTKATAIDHDLQWSAPATEVVVLEAGQTEADVPAGTPDGALIVRKV